MNSWHFSGQVLKYGIKGTKFPKLWLHVSLHAPKALNVSENKLFINFDIDPNPHSKNGKTAEYIKERLKNHPFFFTYDSLVVPIKLSTKNDAGEWEEKEVTGVRSKLNNLVLSQTRFNNINSGTIFGKVSTYHYDATNDISKLIIEERYRNPKTNEFKSRAVPVMYYGSLQDLTNSYVFVSAFLCGVTPDNTSKVYALAKEIIVT